MKVIDIHGLCFSYPNNSVLRNLDYSLEEGEFSAIIGHNGSGKSTLIKIILGELSPQRGKVEINGRKIEKSDPLPMIGYVPQRDLVEIGFPGSVLEIVRGNLYCQTTRLNFFKKEVRSRVQEALELVGAGKLIDKQLGQLSGGQRQRVMLARALVHDPEILILDEPNKGLDSGTTAKFYRLLREINLEQGVSIIAVTHDIDNLYSYVDSIRCLGKGYLLKLSKEDVGRELEHRHYHPEREEA